MNETEVGERGGGERILIRSSKTQCKQRKEKKMLSTTKTYPCAKKLWSSCARDRKIMYSDQLWEGDAVIPLRMSWARNPTGGDTHWSKLVFHKLCIPSLRLPWNSYFNLLAENRWHQTYTCALKTPPDPRVKLQSRSANKTTSDGKKTESLRLIYVKNHLFRLIRGCVCSPKKTLLMEGCRKRIAPPVDLDQSVP